MSGAGARRPVVGEDLPALTLPITYLRIVQGAAATLDWFPGHMDPDFARRQGVPTIYVNTMTFHGIVDRFVLEWAGPEATLCKRSIRMRRPLHAGQDAVVAGTVEGIERRQGAEIVELEIAISSPEGVCVSAAATVKMLRETLLES